MKKYNVVLVGGGSIRNPEMMATLVRYKEKFPIGRFVLYDIDQKRQEIMAQYGQILFREYYPEMDEFIWTDDPDVAFADIDFALMQIRSGNMEMREKDEKIPLKHGLVGQETCGAGGFAYGLRSIPEIVEIIKKIRELSPEAWIINYSNPAAIVAEATRRIFPGDYKILNICDMPIAIMERYAEMLGCSRHDFEPRYFGLNHYGWFTHVYDKKTGEDLAPRIKKCLLDGYTFGLGDEEHTLDPSWIETYNTMADMLRDFPEYLPNTYLKYYLYPNRVVEHSDSNHTRYDEIMEGKYPRVHKKLNEIIAANAIRGTKYDLDNTTSVHASYIFELATSILNNENEIFLVIVKNNGTIPNLDPEAMVEVACRVGINGPEPLSMEPIGTFYKGMIESQHAYERLAVDGLLEKDKGKLLQALTLNRTISDADRARAVLDDLIDANKDYWGADFRA